MRVVLTGDRLTVGEVVQVARNNAPVELDHAAAERMAVSRRVVESLYGEDATVYGLTTGVGARKRFASGHNGSAQAFSRSIISTHRLMYGPPLDPQRARAAIVCLVNGFARGMAGVRPELAARLVDRLNRSAVPPARSGVSTGCGDLAPMANLVDGLVDGYDLAPGEGLALINNNALTTGSVALAIADTERLLDLMDVSCAVDLDAFAANPNILHEAVCKARPYHNVARTVHRLRDLLSGSDLWHHDARNLQDPLSYRSIPHIQAAARDALEFANQQVATELNAAQENPVVLSDEGRMTSIGSFDFAVIAMAIDFLRLALANALTASCERTHKLFEASFSGLPEGLADRSGQAESAFENLGVASHALAAELRLLAQPVSIEVVTTTHAEGIEDRVNLGPLAVQRLFDIVALGRTVIGIALVVAARAAALRAQRDTWRPGVATRAVTAFLRSNLNLHDAGEIDLDSLTTRIAAADFADLSRRTSDERMRTTSTRAPR